MSQVEAPEEQRTEHVAVENASIEKIELLNERSVLLNFTNGSTVIVESEALKQFALSSASEIVNAGDVDEADADQ